MTASKTQEKPVKAADVPAQAQEPVDLAEAATEDAGGRKRLEGWKEWIAENGGASKDASDLRMVPIELLALAKRNPRRGAVAEVIESLREFGQHRPCVVQLSEGEVSVGNHLLRAARQLGWPTVACFVVDEDDDKALRRALADNFVGDKAGWDEAELAEVLKETGAVPGITDSEVEKLLKGLAQEGDEPPAEPTYPLVPRLNEHYDYVLVFAENETDWTWLMTRFDLRKEKSYKSGAVARSHVVTVSRMQELLGD